MGDQPLQLAGGRVQCGLRQSVDGRKLKFLIKDENARLIVFFLVEKTVQRIALPQEVEPHLRDTQYERLPSQLTEPQYAAGSRVGAIVPGTLVERGDLCILAEPCLPTGSRPPLKRDDLRLRCVWEEGGDGIADAVQRLDFLQYQQDAEHTGQRVALDLKFTGRQQERRNPR